MVWWGIRGNVTPIAYRQADSSRGRQKVRGLPRPPARHPPPPRPPPPPPPSCRKQQRTDPSDCISCYLGRCGSSGTFSVLGFLRSRREVSVASVSCMIGVGICRVIQWTSSMKCAASWRRQVCEREFLGKMVARRGPRPGQDEVGHSAVLRAGCAVITLPAAQQQLRRQHQPFVWIRLTLRGKRIQFEAICGGHPPRGTLNKASLQCASIIQYLVDRKFAMCMEIIRSGEIEIKETLIVGCTKQR